MLFLGEVLNGCPSNGKIAVNRHLGNIPLMNGLTHRRDQIPMKYLYVSGQVDFWSMYDLHGLDYLAGWEPYCLL